MLGNWKVRTVVLFANIIVSSENSWAEFQLGCSTYVRDFGASLHMVANALMKLGLYVSLVY